MLYTFSQADYGYIQLERHLNKTTERDAILLWQDGVLLAFKYPELFLQAKAKSYLSQIDLKARQLSFSPPQKWGEIVSIESMVDLTEHYFPQIAL